MIFTMDSDGSLTASRSQDRFARISNDDIGQGETPNSCKLVPEKLLLNV